MLDIDRAFTSALQHAALCGLLADWPEPGDDEILSESPP